VLPSIKEQPNILEMSQEKTEALTPKNLVAWINNSRNPMLPNQPFNISVVKAIQKILPANTEVSKQVPLCEWNPI